MTVVKTLATHEIVQLTYPRPVTEKDEVGKVVGRVIDGALARYSHEASQGRRPTAASIHRFATDLVREESGDADLELAQVDREKILAQVAGVLQAFRKSEIFGLARPRSRLILINSTVGVYAQPDFWDGRTRFYEMKSYRAVPAPPDVALQMRVFQLAFAGLGGFLICFDRHATPVQTTILPFAPQSREETESLLRMAYTLGEEHGKDKVLEYIDNPTVHYSVSIES